MKQYLFIIAIVLTIMFSCDNKARLAKEAVHHHIKKNLRDPESFKVYSEHVEKDPEYKTAYIVTVDYGAANGFGGVERSTEKYKVVGDLVIKTN